MEREEEILKQDREGVWEENRIHAVWKQRGGEEEKQKSGIRNWGAEGGRGRLGQSVTYMSENITKSPLLCILTLKLFF